MTDYTRIIDQIIPSGHPGSTLGDGMACLVLNEETRALVPDNEFNTVIGATNDINTNIITIKIPESIEGHNLSTCDYKILKWANSSSKQKGISNLVSEGTYTFKWVPPPEAMTASGNLKISLTFYDEDDYGKITYRFNSLPYSDLSIGQGMDEIGINPISEDEIITVDLSSRNIIVPSSLNREIGKIGEQNLNTLKFRCNRYFQDKDFWDAGINILHQIGDTVCPYEIENKRLIPGIHDGEYDSLEQRSDLIEFEWEITQALLNMQHAGAIEFAVYILLEGEKTTIWKSNINSELYTGETIMLTGEGDIQPETGEIVLVNGENLDKKLDELLGPDGMEKSGATSTTDAIIYAIERLLGSEFIFDAGDASEFIQSEE